MPTILAVARLAARIFRPNRNDACFPKEKLTRPQRGRSRRGQPFPETIMLPPLAVEVRRGSQAWQVEQPGDLLCLRLDGNRNGWPRGRCVQRRP